MLASETKKGFKMMTCRLAILLALLGAFQTHAQDDDEVIDLQELLLKVSKGFTTFSQEMKGEFTSFAETLRSLNQGMKEMKVALEEVRKSSNKFTVSNEEIKQNVEKSTNVINTIGQNVKIQMEKSTGEVTKFIQDVKDQLKQSDTSLIRFEKIVEEQSKKSESNFKKLEDLIRGLSKTADSSCEDIPKKYETILTRLNDVRELSISIRDFNREVREEVKKSSSSVDSIVQSQKELKETMTKVKEVTEKIHTINTSVEKESTTCSSSIEAFLKEHKIWKESLNERIDKVVEKFGTCDKEGGKDKDEGEDKDGDKDVNDKSPVLDCSDAYKKYGYRTSQVYNIKPLGVKDAFPVYCDMSDGGGWTVIQRRGNYGNPDDFFFRTWADYKYGFGNLNKEFWLGNGKISLITGQQEYQAKIDLWDLSNDHAFARYNNFKVESELGNYMLRVNGYSGTAGDALKHHNNSPFSTRDNNNMLRNLGCAENDWMSGWWYGGCAADLNGLNVRDHQTQTNKLRGIKWTQWMGEDYSLGGSVIKIRPKNY